MIFRHDLTVFYEFIILYLKTLTLVKAMKMYLRVLIDFPMQQDANCLFIMLNSKKKKTVYYLFDKLSITRTNCKTV